MIRTSLIIITFQLSMIFAQEPVGEIHTAAFSVAYAKDPIAAKMRAEALSGKTPYNGSVHGVITSKSIAIGSGMFVLSGKYFDKESQSILNVGCAFEAMSEHFHINGLPSALYSIVFNVHGRSVYKYEKVVGDGANMEWDIPIPSSRPIAGVISGIPTWTLDNAFLQYGPTMVAAKYDGIFKAEVFAQPEDDLNVLVRLPNQYKDEWDQALYVVRARMGITLTTEMSNLALNFPSVGKSVSIRGMASLSAEASKAFLQPVLQNTTIEAKGLDSSLSFLSVLDAQGRFLFIGLPNGGYVITVNLGAKNPPLSCKPIRLQIDNKNESSIKLEIGLGDQN